MEFKILGSLAIEDDGHPLDPGGPRQRALLAILLLHRGTVVPAERLIHELYGSRPPASAATSLRAQVSRLRKALSHEGLIRTRAGGYAIEPDPDSVDADRFERLVAEGRHLRASGEVRGAADLFREALALWRGSALADFLYDDFAQSEIARLEELRVAAIEERIGAELELGHHAELVGELEQLVGQFPVREGLRGQLMLALYRSGRQAEALEAYLDARRALTEELGIEPGKPLRELEQSILRQDPALDLDVGVTVSREVTPARAPNPAPVDERSERKTVTAVHVRLDLTSTDGDRLDAEILRRVSTRSMDTAVAAVEAHEGTIETVTGNAVTAVFGLPVVHEDDAVRAATAAEEVRSRLLALATELESEAAVRLCARIGVSTGEVMTGGPARLRAAGEPLSHATELAETAESGDVLLDDTTQRAVSSRRESGRFTSPMVGRTRERRRLDDAFEQAVADRSCQLFTILGTAGVGKSRLVQEFFGDVSGRALTARGRCLPYGEGITFWPILEAVTDVAGIVDSDSTDEATMRVAALVDEETDVALRVTELIGLREGSAALDEGFATIRRFFELLAAKRPLVILFDDVHWGEQTFLDLVEDLADWSRGAPMLVLCVARPELLDARPSWGGGKLNATSVLLEPLSSLESAELVGNLVGEATLAEEVQEHIASAAEGNPLFVEEMLSMLIDDGVLVRNQGRWTAVRDLATFPVPPTIQALLAARLDQLNADERTTLEAAAVEGKIFHVSSVAVLAEGRQYEAALASLVRKELIRPEQSVFQGEHAFRFRHLMIRDAAYAAVPKESRAQLHERHVDWLEARTTERTAEFDEIVGYHLERAAFYRSELGHSDGETAALGKRAAERLASAARRAFLRTDLPAALNLASRASVLLPADDALRVELVPTLRMVQGMPEPLELGWADRVLTEAIEAAATTGNRSLAAHALVQRGLLRLFTGAEVTAHELLTTARQAVTVFEDLGDEIGLSRAWRLASQAHYLDRSSEQSTEAAERALVHARRGDDRYEQAEIVEWFLVTLLFGPRPVAESCELCIGLRRELDGRPELEALVAAGLAWLEACRGRGDDARTAAGDALRAMDAHGASIFFVRFSLAHMLTLLDDDAGAAEIVRAGYEVLRSTGRGGHYGAAALLLARVCYAEKRYDDAERFVDEATRHTRANDIWNQSQHLGVRARIFARRGDLETAVSVAYEALDLAAAGDFVLAQVDAWSDLAEVLRLAGRYEEAMEAIDRAISLHEARGNVGAVRKAQVVKQRLRHEALD
jgi:predicted ATPase/DNA-binding SARP family transcriptional activator